MANNRRDRQSVKVQYSQRRLPRTNHLTRWTGTKPTRTPPASGLPRRPERLPSTAKESSVTGSLNVQVEAGTKPQKDQYDEEAGDETTTSTTGVDIWIPDKFGDGFVRRGPLPRRDV